MTLCHCPDKGLEVAETVARGTTEGFASVQGGGSEGKYFPMMSWAIRLYR